MSHSNRELAHIFFSHVNINLPLTQDLLFVFIENFNSIYSIHHNCIYKTLFKTNIQLNCVFFSLQHSFVLNKAYWSGKKLSIFFFKTELFCILIYFELTTIHSLDLHRIRVWVICDRFISKHRHINTTRCKCSWWNMD